MVLPAVVLVLACSLGALQTVGLQVRLTDAAAAAARMLGRGEDANLAVARLQVSIADAALRTERRGSLICAQLSAPSRFGPFALAGLRVTAVSCAPTGGL